MGRVTAFLLRVACWVVALTAAALALRLSAGTVLAVGERATSGGSVRTLPLTDLVAAGCATVLGAAVLWLLLVTALTVLEVLAGRAGPTARALSPTIVRRLVLAGCGVAVAAVSATPAAATALSPGPAGGDALAGLPLPDRTAGAVVRRVGSDALAAPAAPGSRTHRVRPGETLWSIAASLLPAGAGSGEVDATWRGVYRANRAAVGDDPDLLIVGTLLRLPSSATADTPSSGEAPAAPDRKDS